MQVSNPQQYINSNLARLTACESKDIQVFGASKFGWFVSKALFHLGFTTSHFIESSPTRVSYTHVPIASPLQIKKNRQKSQIIVAVFRQQARAEWIQRLRCEGMTVLDVDPFALLFVYFTEVASRPVNKAMFAITIFNLSRFYSLPGHPHGLIFDDLFVSPLVVGNVTQKCNLKCLDCAQRIPYYDEQQDFSPDQVVKEITAYCNSVDLVPEISLHGGEPFLYPHLGEICLALSRIPNLVFINLITNGTVLPKQSAWKQLQDAGVDLHQSDYGNISKRQDAIFNLAEDHNIYCDIDFTNISQKWHRPKPLQDYGRDAEDNDSLYKACVATKICAQILDGRLYRCPVSAHAGRQGHFENVVGRDFVELDLGGPADEIRSQVRSFLQKPTCLTACEFCDPFDPIEVSPALQMNRKNLIRIARGEELV